MIEKFIVLAAHRSGTTLLLSSLESHPQITCHKRIFTVDVMIKRVWVRDRPGSSFHQFRTASLKRRLDYVFRSKQLINDFMSELDAPGDDVRQVGVRVIYAEADKHPEILQWAKDHDVGIIHLIRENALKTLLSAETARKRGLSHSTSKVKGITVHLSPFKLKLQLTRLTQQIEKYRMALKNTRHLEVSYEALVARPEAETQRILEFLQLEQVGSLTTNLVKLNPNSLQHIIENYAEVKQALQGTAFEKFFEEEIVPAAG